MDFTVLEICAGAGGQALGLEEAGFSHAAALDNDHHACNTLRLNRPKWEVLEGDVRALKGSNYRGADLLAGGIPCPPFSIAGKQLGPDDERDLFPEVLRLAGEARPAAIMLENVKGLAAERFSGYRDRVLRSLYRLGYAANWRVLNASSYGVPQLRPRFVLVAFRGRGAELFQWPQSHPLPKTVGEVLWDLMVSKGWRGAARWKQNASGIAPTLVGGSKKHGGPDLGPTRARQQWAQLGVDGLGIADEPPDRSFPVSGMPRLTVRMAARLQGFPDSWALTGGKTAAYRQVGNAFPPPVARAVGASIHAALSGKQRAGTQKKLALTEA